MAYNTLPLAEKLSTKAVQQGECLIWIGQKDRKGYGRLRINGRHQRAHRVAYELHVGPIPSDAVLRHRCDNPSCIALAHLVPGTQRENIQDMADRGRRRSVRGDANAQTKLSPEQVRVIRERFIPFDRKHGARALAREVGVSHESVSAVIRGRSHAHVGGSLPAAHDKHALKVSAEQVQQIRARYIAGSKDSNLYTLGAEFGITASAVRRIVKRQTYKGVA